MGVSRVTPWSPEIANQLVLASDLAYRLFYVFESGCWNMSSVTE